MIYCPVCQPDDADPAWIPLTCVACRAKQDGAPRPVCQYCQEPILPGERKRLEAWIARDMHDECLVRMVMGSAAHQLRECRCFGGVREDPPGMTLREAAKLAYDTFMTMRASAGTD